MDIEDMMLWTDAIQHFIRELRIRGYSRRTLDAYLFDIEKFNEYLNISLGLDLGSIRVDAIDTQVIRGWMDDRLTSGNSTRTMARKLATIKSLFRFLYDQNFVRENPADKLKLPRIRKNPPSALSQDEIRQLIKAPDPEGKNYLMERALLTIIYSCGLRVSEAASLRIESLNMERQHLRVSGKGSKQRIIPLQDSVRRIVLEYILHRERVMPETMSAGAALFVKMGAKGPVEMNVRRIQYLVERCGREAGLLTHVYPHLLRHSIATHMIEEGANVEAVRQTLGHEDLATTSIYVKASSKFLMQEHKKFNPSDNLIKNQ